MSSLSTLRRDKLKHLFDILDLNHNGYIERTDLQTFVDKMADARYYLPDSQAYQALQRIYDRLWSHIAAEVDTNRDYRLTREEWLGYVEGFSSESTFHEAFVGPLERMFVSLLDINGDDRIELGDFLVLGRACGIDQDAVQRMFELLDENQDGEITPAEVGHALDVFFLGDEAGVPLNGLFGYEDDAS